MLLVAFFLWECWLGRRPGGQPLIDLALFRSASFTWGVILLAILVLAMIGVLFTMPQYFQGVLGTDAQGSGIRLLPLIGGLVVGAVPADRIARVLGAKVTVAMGFARAGGGMLLGSTTGVASSGGFIAAWMAVVGLGMGITLCDGGLCRARGAFGGARGGRLRGAAGAAEDGRTVRDGGAGKRAALGVSGAAQPHGAVRSGGERGEDGPLRRAGGRGKDRIAGIAGVGAVGVRGGNGCVAEGGRGHRRGGLHPGADLPAEPAWPEGRECRDGRSAETSATPTTVGSVAGG